MGDTSSAHLKIGGEVKAELLPELVEIMTDEGFVIEYDDSPSVLVDAFVEAAKAGETSPEFYLYEAIGGNIPETEAFLTEHGIDFVHWQDGHWAYNADEHARIAGRDYNVLLSITNDRMLEIDRIKDALAEGVEVLEQIMTRPELPPLVIIPEDGQDGT